MTGTAQVKATPKRRALGDITNSRANAKAGTPAAAGKGGGAGLG